MVLKVAVIGGGVSGLVTLKYLLEAKNFFPGVEIEARLFEAKKDIGGVFKYQVYEDAELVSSKYLTAFSDFRIPKDEPDFITPERYIQYLKNYADKFQLWDHIQLSTTITSLTPHPTKIGHVLNLDVDKSTNTSDIGLIEGPVHYHVVAICSGLNRTKFIPTIPGLETFPFTELESVNSKNAVKLLHSSDFKSSEQFGKDTTVLILGVGETAMDIGALAIKSDIRRVIMSHRDGFWYAPKIVPRPFVAGGRRRGGDPHEPGKPIDCCNASLFDTAYVPPIIQRSFLPWSVYEGFVKGMAWVISGTTAGFDQWIGGVGPDRFHVDGNILVKSDRALPYISEQYRSKSKLNQWRTWLINVPLYPTGGKVIDLAPWPEYFDDSGVVHFQKTDRPESKKMESEKGIRPDVIIFCTGYQQSFPFMPKDDERYPTLHEATTRNMYRDIEDGIAYIGFIRPSFGAIPPLAELQAQNWIYHLVHCPKYQPFFSNSTNLQPVRSKSAIPPYDLTYQLNLRGDKAHHVTVTKRAVDHESYAYQLALDIGAAPTITHMLLNYDMSVVYTWAMSPNFPTKFRLIGPWSSQQTAKEAVDLMGKDGELGKLAHRTGGAVFFTAYTVIPLLIFTPICLLINFFTGIWWVITGPFTRLGRL